MRQVHASAPIPVSAMCPPCRHVVTPCVCRYEGGYGHKDGTPGCIVVTQPRRVAGAPPRAFFAEYPPKTSFDLLAITSPFSHDHRPSHRAGDGGGAGGRSGVPCEVRPLHQQQHGNQGKNTVMVLMGFFLFAVRRLFQLRCRSSPMEFC
jgi:hypothetical protein